MPAGRITMKKDKILQEHDIRRISKLSELSGLGLTAGNYHAIILLPAVYVALAGNKITEKQNRELISMVDGLSVTGREEAGLVCKWLSEGVREDLMEEGIRALFLLVVTGPHAFPCRNTRRIIAFAKRVAGASYRKSEKYSGGGSRQRAALRRVRMILQSIRGRWWAWPAKIMYRHITNRKIVDDVSGISGFPASDPFLFTSPGAIRDYKAGKFNKADGSPYLLADLENDLRTEIGRAHV